MSDQKTERRPATAMNAKYMVECASIQRYFHSKIKAEAFAKSLAAAGTSYLCKENEHGDGFTQIGEYRSGKKVRSMDEDNQKALRVKDYIRLVNVILSHHQKTFPNYVYSGAECSVDLMAHEITTLRVELAKALVDSIALSEIREYLKSKNAVDYMGDPSVPGGTQDFNHLYDPLVMEHLFKMAVGEEIR